MYSMLSIINNNVLGFPGGPVVKVLPANAGGWGSIPAPGRLIMLPSLCTTTIETRAPKQKKPPQWETCAPKLESSPCSVQLEKVHVKQWRSSAAKKKKKDYCVFESA